MEVKFPGSYKKYKLVQNAERPNEIDLHNVVTGHKKSFLKIYSRLNMNFRLAPNTNNYDYNQNKK